MAADEHGIEVRGLVREFKGGIRAVDGIDLRVDPGQIYGFLGPNGAGKTTTVLMLTTLLPVTAGKATVAGFDVSTEGEGVRRSIGAALQETALDPLLSGAEHMRLQCALQGLRRDRRAARSAELLERVGLTEAAKRKVKTYSGGMRRRLDLALALVHEPRILFLDEPTTGLDPQSRAALWSEVRKLSEGGVTILLTTQYLEEADKLAHRVGIIDNGKIVAEGSPAELKARVAGSTLEVVPNESGRLSAVARVLARFGKLWPQENASVSVQLDRGPSQIADIVRALDEEGVAVENLKLHSPSLDDVFLAETGRKLEGARDEPTGEHRAEG